MSEKLTPNKYLNDLLYGTVTGPAKRQKFFENADRLNLYSTTGLNAKSKKRMETRTRKQDPETALSFGIHDPLWFLTRQWQFGEFKGNDAGSAIWAKIKIKHSDVTGYGDTAGNYLDGNREAALEYYVERRNYLINEGVRVEAAFHLKKRLEQSDLRDKSKAILKVWKSKYPLDRRYLEAGDYANPAIPAKESLTKVKQQNNEAILKFMSAFALRAFDGHALYLKFKHEQNLDEEIKGVLSDTQQQLLKNLLSAYVVWFTSVYLPAEDDNRFWIGEQLGYDAFVAVRGQEETQGIYRATDYNTGRLSWHSFDQDEPSAGMNPGNVEAITAKDQSEQVKYFSFIPVLAGFPGAPNKRLWAFEDHKVIMGNSGLAVSDMASAMIMQFTTMYSNDWLLTPLELEVGRVTSVEGILVTDVFGRRYYLDRPVGGTTTSDVRYSGKWELFTISKKDAYLKEDFKTDGKLFFPPSVPRTEESTPLEEVQFLRDEMANMVWGVELKIDDGSGRSMDGDDLAGKMSVMLKDLIPGNPITGEDEETPDYRYLFQNGVAMNWIPFSPVKFEPGSENYEREIRLQRSAMPLFLKNTFVPVRPNGRLLRDGIDEEDKVKAYQYINEEEILAVGTKVSMNYQRTRWFDGKTYNWLGFKKEIQRMQANSGLTFDELVEVIGKNMGQIALKKINKIYKYKFV